jgi:AcrR family transcriptional regulator
MRMYGGLSALERQMSRRTRLIEAGLDVLGSRGLSAMTMTEVCARAGLTERYFYESFRNLDELLVAVFDAFSVPTHRAIELALRQAPPDLFERCRAAAGALIDSLTQDPRKARAYVEAIGSTPLRARREATMRAYAEVLADQMRSLSGLGGRHHQASLRLVTTMLVGGLAEAVGEWLNGALLLSKDELADEASRLCVSAADALSRSKTATRPGPSPKTPSS